MFDLEMTHIVDNRAGDVKPVQFAALKVGGTQSKLFENVIELSV